MDFFVDQVDVMGMAAAFLTQVGARHLILNFSDVQKKLIAHPISQAFILFGMFYLSTRKITYSLSLVIVYYILVNVLINEQHPFNIIPRKWLISEGLIDGEEKSPIEMYYENIESFRDR